MEERFLETYTIAEYKFDATVDTMPTFNEGYSPGSVYDYDNGDGTITRIIVSGVKPTSISFTGCTGLLEVTMISTDGNSYVDLFSGCTNLTYVNMNNWDDYHITHTGSMFRNCTSLKTIDMEDWDKTNLVNIVSMFYGCSSLTTINGVENLIGPKVTFGTHIFSGCSSLTEIDVSNWDNRISDMRAMFNNCTNLSKIIGVEKLVSNYNTHIFYLFSGCSSLTEIDVSGWDVSNAVHTYSIFKGCSSLTELDLSNWDVTKFTSMSSLFSGCVNLRNIFMLNWASSSCSDMQFLFEDCNIKLLDFSSWDFSSATTMNGMISGCKSLETMIFDNINLNKVDTSRKMASSLDSLKSVIVKNSTAANINKLIEILPRGNSAINCKIYLPLTQNMSEINVATANSKGWKVVQGSIVKSSNKGNNILYNSNCLGVKCKQIHVGDTPFIKYK